MHFQIRDRAAAGRIGRLETSHGIIETPTLMPVVNPNIDLVRPQEMADRFGMQALITNSYVMHKHESLRERALSDGVHAVLDWQGPIMTDSGTFQMYVYGDVEVEPDEIVAFQRDIGVDIATCLDKFVTPDMGRQEAEAGVAETLERTRAAAALLGDPTERKTMLNATVQGGVFGDLRQACAAAYRELDVEYHTIGGVVPLMERQMYPELVEAILHAQQYLRHDRAVHLFGAGHPLVFPLAVALGCDLFDSSSYAKYAKDGRIITPEGTLHAERLSKWPFPSHALADWTPAEVTAGLAARGADGPNDAERALALHNLDVCFSEIRRIHQAIKEGTLWELVEQRAACHPMLAAATKRLGQSDAQAWLEAREPVSGDRALRYTGHLTHGRPMFGRIRRHLVERYTPVAEPVEVQGSEWAEDGELKVELAMHKEPRSKPWNTGLGALDGDQEHMVISAFGPTPLGLAETYPFSQSVLPRLEGLDSGHMAWVGQTKDAVLEAHGMVPAIPGPPMPGEALDMDALFVRQVADWQFGRGAGKLLTNGTLRLKRSRKTGKVRNVLLDDVHILSLRAGDGFFTLKLAGAALLHGGLDAPRLRVRVQADSVPFNRDGKSAFAQFVDDLDPALRPGDECLVVGPDDALVATGQLLLAPSEVADFESGMAVRVRDGIPPA